jgi:hypothetical protein
MSDAADNALGKVVIFDIEGLRRIGFADAGPLTDPTTLRSKFKGWIGRMTQPFGIALAWNPDRPVYTDAGAARVPPSPGLLAVSAGDLDACPEDVFAIDACFGRSPGKIVIRRLPKPPKWLDQRVTWDLRQPTLDEVRRAIELEAEGSVTLDWPALKDEGLTPTTRYADLSARSLPLRSALSTWLEDLNLAVLQIGSTMRITTRLEADNWHETRLYFVGDLLMSADPQLSASELIRFVMRTVGPNTWQPVGGAGDLVSCIPEQTLVVSQSQRNHEELERLLTALRQSPSSKPSAR